MARTILADEPSSKPKYILLAEPIYDKPYLGLTVEGMLYQMRVGCRWRDLPDFFGAWNMVYHRFRASCQSRKWWRIVKALISDPDLEWAFIPLLVGQGPLHRGYRPLAPQPTSLASSTTGSTPRSRQACAADRPE